MNHTNDAEEDDGSEDRVSHVHTHVFKEKQIEDVITFIVQADITSNANETNKQSNKQKRPQLQSEINF